MLVFFEANLALFATPKTGSTAYHMALRKHAEIAMVNRAAVKHLSVGDYRRHMAPFLQTVFGLTPEGLAVMREPLDLMRSWYRYRQRPKLDGLPNSTKGISFDDFLEALMSDSPPVFARVGWQAPFLTVGTPAPAVDHLFAYDNIEGFHRFLERRLGFEFATRPFNTSPEVPAEADPGLVARFRDRFAREEALYEQLRAAGGYLHTPQPPPG